MKGPSPWLLLAWLGGLGVACASSASEQAPVECAVPSFRGCEDPCGRGVQECVAPGRFGPCRCTLIDGALPDAAGAPDAREEASAEAGDAGPSGD